MRTPNEKSKRIVARLLQDMSGRKGLGDEWDMIDDDVQDEIIQEWVNLVFEELVEI